MNAPLHPCHRCESPIERGDLRCAICGLPTPVTPAGAVATDEIVAAILRCNGCGAAVAYDAKAGAPKCGFCGSVMEVETPEDPIEEAQSFLVFRVDAAQAFRRPLDGAFKDAAAYAPQSSNPTIPAGMKSHFDGKTVPKDARRFPPNA